MTAMLAFIVTFSPARMEGGASVVYALLMELIAKCYAAQPSCRQFINDDDTSPIHPPRSPVLIADTMPCRRCLIIPRKSS